MRLVTFREYENFVANHNIRGELSLIEMLRYFAAGAQCMTAGCIQNWSGLKMYIR